MRRVRSSIVLALAFVASAACSRQTPPEPDTPQKDPATTSIPSAAQQATLNSALSAPKASGGAGNGGDPLDGVYSLVDATKDLGGSGAILATIDTSMGPIKCKLFDDKAPVTVANFIGLASGARAWKDPSGKWVNRPAYDGTTFHRVIQGFMIQGGDAKGNGSGEPGYVIKDEVWPGATHDHAGELCMANRGPNTNGAQFFITDAAALHLDASYTIFGECSPVETIHKIASTPVAGERPITPVTIKSVKIAREKPGPAPSASGASSAHAPATTADAGKK